MHYSGRYAIDVDPTVIFNALVLADPIDRVI